MKNLKFYLLIFTISSSVILLSFMLLPKEQVGEKKLFKDFISQFDKAELPYEIEISKISSNEEQATKGQIQIEEDISSKLISHNFSAFIPGLARSMYSRMPPSRYYFKDVVFENENFVLVTYGVQSYRGRLPNTVDEYVLASYSKDGKIKNVDRLLSLRTVAKESYYQLTKSVIGKNLIIKTFVQTDNEKGNGKIADSNETITERYKIAEDGKIKVIMTKKMPQKQEKIIRAN